MRHASKVLIIAIVSLMLSAPAASADWNFNDNSKLAEGEILLKTPNESRTLEAGKTLATSNVIAKKEDNNKKIEVGFLEQKSAASSIGNESMYRQAAKGHCSSRGDGWRPALFSEIIKAEEQGSLSTKLCLVGTTMDVARCRGGAGGGWTKLHDLAYVGSYGVLCVR